MAFLWRFMILTKEGLNQSGSQTNRVRAYKKPEVKLFQKYNNTIKININNKTEKKVD